VYYLHTAFNLTSIIAALSLLLSIRLAFVLIAAYQHYTKSATTAVVAIDLNETRQLWLHLALQDFLQYIFKWIDKVVVVVLLSTSLTAIYFNGSIDIPFLPILLGAFTSAGLLYLAQVQLSDKQQHSIALLHKTGILLNAIVMPLFLFLLFFAAPLFDLFFDHRYAASVPIFQWSILVLPLRAYGFTSILQHAHKGAIINKGALLDLLIAVAAMYPFYWLMGLPGLAFSFVLSSYIQAAYYSVHTAKILQVRVLDLFPLKIWLQQIVLSLILLAIFKIGTYYVPCSLHYLLLAVSISFLFNLIFLWMKKTAIQ
jgi:O-antigen/teichoic acid export membrane protein